jgi:hypothetical protein
MRKAGLLLTLFLLGCATSVAVLFSGPLPSVNEQAAAPAKGQQGVRDPARTTGRKVEGRKSHRELNPQLVAEAKRLHRASPKTGKRRSLRQIAKELAKLGYVNERGQVFTPKSVKRMLEQ